MEIDMIKSIIAGLVGVVVGIAAHDLVPYNVVIGALALYFVFRVSYLEDRVADLEER